MKTEDLKTQARFLVSQMQAAQRMSARYQLGSDLRNHWSAKAEQLRDVAHAISMMVEIHKAHDAAQYAPGDHPVVPVKLAAFMTKVGGFLGVDSRVAETEPTQAKFTISLFEGRSSVHVEASEGEPRQLVERAIAALQSELSDLAACPHHDKDEENGD